MGNDSQPDWYADPTGIHHHRYWDGDRWTARVADRYGATSAHHLQERYPPPGTEGPVAAAPPAPTPTAMPAGAPAQRQPEPIVFVADVADVADVAGAPDDAPMPKRSLRFLRRKRSEPATLAPALEHPNDLGVTKEQEMHAAAGVPEDALVLAAEVLQNATEGAGFSWRDSDLTIDEAINALPVDIADHTVNVMYRLFTTAGDEENARWTEAKLREIKLLKRGYRRLHELVTSTPTDEILERSRRFGVPDDLTADFVEGILSSEIPTVAELRTARLPAGGPDAA